MSREGLFQELQAISVSLNCVKHTEPGLSVYQGSYFSSPAVISVISWDVYPYSAIKAKECMMMRALSHPNIQSFLQHFSVCKEGKRYYVVVTEWWDKDLEEDIKHRARNQFPYTEFELLSICYQTIHALAYMQDLGYAHHNLQPQSLLLNCTQRKIHLGSLGLATQDLYTDVTVIGTNNYFSPIIKYSLQSRQNYIPHNPFKSDVYSLGLIILKAAQIYRSPELLMGDDAMLREINSVYYSEEVKMLLRAMLGFEEENRWDFVQLRDWVEMRPWAYRLSQELYPVSGFGQYAEPSYQWDAATWSRPQRQDNGGEGVEDLDHSPPDVQQESPSKVPVTCIQCKHAIDLQASEKPIQLPCFPDTHMYCSAFCFVKSLGNDHNPIICRQCGSQLPPELVKFLSDEKRKFPSCLRCKRLINIENKAETVGNLSATCSNKAHIFCSPDCLQALRGECPMCVPASRSSLQSFFRWLFKPCGQSLA